MSTNPVAGSVRRLTSDGRPFTIGSGTFTVRVDGYTDEYIEGTSERKRNAGNTFIRGTLTIAAGVKTSEATGIDNERVVLETPEGRQYALSGASFTGNKEINVVDGTIDFEVTAGPDDGEEMLP